MRHTVSVLLALVVPVPLLAGVLRVPGDFPSLQGAVDAAAAGDSVLLASGTYTDSVRVTGKEELFLIGEKGSEATILDGGEKWVPLQLTDCKGPVVVSGITFQGGKSYVNGGGLVVRKSTVHLSDCRFVANHAENSGGGLHLSNCPHFSVERCLFEKNVCVEEASAASVVGGEGVFAGNILRDNSGALAVVFMQTACKVRDNLIVRNTCSDFGALAYQLALSGLLDGNTIASNTGKPGMGAVLIQMGNLRVERNLIAGNTGTAGLFVQSEDGLVRLAGNNLWQNEGGAYVGIEAGEGDLAVDPMFCDAEGEDFHLRAGSPCLGGGGAASRIGALGEGCE